jgi:hypothetical protein
MVVLWVVAEWRRMFLRNADIYEQDHITQKANIDRSTCILQHISDSVTAIFVNIIVRHLVHPVSTKLICNEEPNKMFIC